MKKSTLTILTLTIMVNLTHQNYFDSQKLTEMNKLNKNHLYTQHKYMLGYFADGVECDEECKETIEILKKTKNQISEKIPIEIVWINSNENRKLVKELRVIEVPSIAYLANKKVVVYQGDEDTKSLSQWIKKRVILPSEGYSKSDEIDGIKAAWNIFVNYVGKRNRYYQAFRYVASSYADLHFVHSFSAPVSH